jgi:predicted dehydrogenase
MASDAHPTYRLSSFGKKRDVLSVLRDSHRQVAKTGKNAFNLPSNVKAYGDPTAFTADPDINLLAQINIHVSVVEPSLKAGKSVCIK